MFIESPSSGYKAEVNEENRIMAESVSYTSTHHTNHHEGKAYSFRTSVTPTAAGDCFAYITNNDELDMMIDMFIVSATTDETILVKLGDEGTPAGGSTSTLINLNAGSGNEADVTAETGVDITGLSGGSECCGFFMEGGRSTTPISIPPSLIIPKNKTISFYVETGGIAVRLGALVTFHSSTH